MRGGAVEHGVAVLAAHCNCKDFLTAKRALFCRFICAHVQMLRSSALTVIARNGRSRHFVIARSRRRRRRGDLPQGMVTVVQEIATALTGGECLAMTRMSDGSSNPWSPAVPAGQGLARTVNMAPRSDQIQIQSILQKFRRAPHRDGPACASARFPRDRTHPEQDPSAAPRLPEGSAATTPRFWPRAQVSKCQA